MSLNETFHDDHMLPRPTAPDVNPRNRRNGPETVTMATLTADKTRSSRKPVAKDTMEYRLIFAVCLPVFLVATLAERLTAGVPAGTELVPAKSLLVEAVEATHRCTSLAFMG
jgi:hypothetical protein